MNIGLPSLAIGRGSFAPPSLSDFDSLLSGWWLASRGTTGTSEVTAWASGKAGVAAFAKSGTGPALTAAVFGGNPGLLFDGATMGMIGPASLIAQGEGTILALVKPTDFINDAAAHYNNDMYVADNGGAAYGIVGRKNTPRVYAYNYDGTQDTAGSTAAVADSVYLLQWRHSGGQLYFRVNEAAESAGTASGNTASVASQMTLFRGFDGNRHGKGYLGALVTASAAIPAADLVRIRAILRDYAGSLG